MAMKADALAAGGSTLRQPILSSSDTEDRNSYYESKLVDGARVVGRAGRAELDAPNTDDALLATIAARLARLDEKEKRDEDDIYLTSTHQILFKLSDYASLPGRLPSCDFSGFLSIIIGNRKCGRKGHFIADDHSRFLFVFHNAASAYLVFCAVIIFLAQFVAVFALLKEAHETEITSCSDSVSVYPILLCILYSAAAALDDLLSCVPFEIVGISRLEYCFKITKANMQGKQGRFFYWSKTIGRLWKSGTPEEKFKHLFDFYELLSAVGPSFFLLINNLQLVITIGIIMAISTDMLSLVQNFIAVEILVHVHEMIPPLMRLQDRSPHRFTKDVRQALNSFEKIGAIPVYLKDKNGADGKRARLSYQRFNNVVFSIYSVGIFCVYMLVLHEKGCPVVFNELH